MKFSQKFIIICAMSSPLLYAEDYQGANDFLRIDNSLIEIDDNISKLRENMLGDKARKITPEEISEPKRENPPEEIVAKKESPAPKTHIEESPKEDEVFSIKAAPEPTQVAQDKIPEPVEPAQTESQSTKPQGILVAKIPQKKDGDEALSQLDKEEVLSVNTNTETFKISSENTNSFSKMKEICTSAENIVYEYLGKKAKSKINLYVNSETNETYLNQFSTETYKDGAMYITIRWDENLSHSALCDFIIRSTLRKIAIEEGAIQTTPPHFLCLSLATLLEQRTDKSLMFDFAKEASQTNLLGLEDILNIEKNDKPSRQEKLSAFWNLLALNKIFKNKRDLDLYLSAYLLKGKDFDLYSEIAQKHQQENLAIYFRCIVNSEINSRLGGIMNMQDSADEILRMCFIRKDSRNQAFGDIAIFENRADKEIQNAIRNRLMEIKLLLPYINPLYFNSLVSLGEVFEAALNDKKEIFETTRQEFIGYFRLAKYLESKANAILEN